MRTIMLILAVAACAEPEEMTWGDVAFELGEISCQEDIVDCGGSGSVAMCAEHVRWHMCEPFGTCETPVDAHRAGVALEVCRRAFARRNGVDCNDGGVNYLPEECDRALALDPQLPMAVGGGCDSSGAPQRRGRRSKDDMRHIFMLPAILVLDAEGNPIKKPELGDDGQVRMVPAKPLAHQSFICETLLTDERVFGKSMKGLIASARMERAFSAAKARTYVPVDDSDHEMLVEAMENPANPYNVRIARQILPFMEGIKAAEKELPEKGGGKKKG